MKEFGGCIEELLAFISPGNSTMDVLLTSRLILAIYALFGGLPLAF